MTYPQLLKELLRNVDQYPDDFAETMNKVQARFFREVIPLLEGMKTGTDGAILATAENYAISQQVTERVEIILAESGYTSALQKYAAGINEQRTVTDALYRIFLDDKTADFAELNAMFANSRKNALTLMGEGAVGNFRLQFTNALDTAISSSSTYTDLIKNIRMLSVGDDQVDGVLERYAKQNAKDAFAITNRSYAEQINRKYDIVFFRYAGANIDTTREFCLKRAGNVYHQNEIKSWAGQSWAGKNAATNEATIFSLLGGYNCNHVLEPVPLDRVPESVMRNAIDKGWVKLEDLPSRIRGKFEE